MTDTPELKALVERIEALLPKVVAGPYITGNDAEFGRDSGCLIWGPLGPGHGTVGECRPINNYVDHIADKQAQAAWFALCNPTNIRLLLSAIATLSARLEQAEEGEREMMAALRGAMVIIDLLPVPDDVGDEVRTAIKLRRSAVLSAITNAEARAKGSNDGH